MACWYLGRLFTVHSESTEQERIYVANEYPTVVRTMCIVCQKFRILRQIILNRRQNMSVLIKNMQILG